MISDLIADLMNEAWLRKHGQSRSSRPFDNLVVANPRVPQQTKADSSIYTGLFALEMLKTRNRPFCDQDYESNCSCLTNSFTFGPKDVSRFKSKMKACILVLQSKSSELSHSQSCVQGQKSMNQGLKSIKQPHVTPSIPVLFNPTKAKTVQQTKMPVVKGEFVIKRELDKKRIEANQKRDERRYKYHFHEQLPILEAGGHVLSKQSQRPIKYWDGGYDGSFVDATQLTMPAKA